MRTSTTQPILCSGILVLLAFLAGCASSPQPSSSSRYSISQDRAPSGDFDASDLEDAVPRHEPYSRGGNKSPYTVWGKQYTVLADASSFVQRGTASWYGEKFHGHKTSNGEIFDMYQMTAAHKNLPLPSYVRVTNLDNGRQAIVRVNDRGPFHGDRIIDLSYAAAKKLGYQGRGTARVEIAAITVFPDGSMQVAGEGKGKTVPAPAPASPTSSGEQGIFVQVASFSQPESAQQLSQRLRNVTDSPVRVFAAGQYHRVQVGPFAQRGVAEEQSRMIEQVGLGRPILVTDPL
ncbi:septal ring lytic transglycosylase RlpA [Marinobacter nanhaiticus D15-8W]|uniref:Endolytic peptidoglycan transglycosylase RlpA n=1 Tax=Marinobacter nanhaiticus D15-8W TaxID=626887 RepID=N6W2Q0_9GAMM|nr:septal ring lytic transglycosylase RlpA family protein [Marinobacter nanhaiticus]ENO16815.2 septal ring lytic transglycosylase RlpA family protein [Marinobacter nanhaiticus D15-8W]BES72630.1 septal ring lytic transglycosylase RlpA [Marinobacter nanhaiticus D15-8W]